VLSALSGRFLAAGQINHGRTEKGRSGQWTVSITEIWRTSSETLRASVAFRVHDRKYLSLRHGTRGEPATSTGEAHPRVTPPKTPVNSRRTYCRLSTMSDTEQLIPSLYREAAEQVRQLAAAAICLNCRPALNDWALMPRPRSAAA
jgi:hypothetical protein